MSTAWARALLVAAVLVGALGVNGCGGGGSEQTELRHETEPLVQRFPGLGQPVSASWMIRTVEYKKDEPPTRYLDAVVELEPKVAAELRTKAATSKPTPFRLSSPLDELAPEGLYLTSAELNRTVGGPNWKSPVSLHETRDILVILSIMNENDPLR